MTKYKITGDKITQYYIEVEANDSDEAWDIAEAAPTHQWFEIESDNTIEIFNVESVDELEDGWPAMDNEILVTGNSVSDN